MGTIANRLQNEQLLRSENLDTDLLPPPGVVEATKKEVELDSANSYLPFVGSAELRQAAAALVSRLSGVSYNWNDEGACAKCRQRESRQRHATAHVRQ